MRAPVAGKPVDPEVLRAAKLSRVPGVTLDAACKRFGVPKAAVQRARKLPETDPSLAELALASLTRNGRARTGTVDLDRIARWIDYINHDGCTASDVRRLLRSCDELELSGTTWRLVTPWP